MKRKLFIISVLHILLLAISWKGHAKDYYVHPSKGKDTNSGLSQSAAFRSLDKINLLKLEAGDKVLLASGEVFEGTISLNGIMGAKNAPIIFQSFSWDGTDNGRAVIDAKSQDAGILLKDCSWITVVGLEIKAEGFEKGIEQNAKMRCGILVTNQKSEKVVGIEIDDVYIHDVFFENPGIKRGENEVKTANGTQRYGWGIRVINSNPELMIQEVKISNCKVENVAHTAIKLTGNDHNIQQVKISNNDVSRPGGPGIQMSGVRFVHVLNNNVQYSGSPDDSRKWGRGSGLWTWGSSQVMIEHNQFMHANGPADSAGAHIDFNCDNVVMQYNFSAFNAGGFCEILGNNFNCSYRFNISVNDGHREKGANGAFQEGKVFWLSGYQGKKARKGPVNSYFYNNTIYVSKDHTAKIAIENNSSGILIANNIFCIEGESKYVLGDQYNPDNGKGNVSLENVTFENNLFYDKGNWPKEAMIYDQSPIYGNPQFANAGGEKPSDYIPSNIELVKKGVEVKRIEGDPFGLLWGLEMPTDFLGREINGAHFIGAIKPE
ncbi:right-handed parallel beta-helix repeat-containing protein [Echinicola shivajiensis]|uniref:right-handed parallel beta-helix repeat-containing protein n=1 Tax=Echinicola shivajiensis TaxID=1035916 RepID=UPI001BFCBF99|nr:right-handed parallel beta-helix repeat-containing protein [Echinicola shivajiensis]